MEILSKDTRAYEPRVVGGQVMMPAELQRLHNYMLDVERIDHISDEMRAASIQTRTGFEPG